MDSTLLTSNWPGTSDFTREISAATNSFTAAAASWFKFGLREVSSVIAQRENHHLAPLSTPIDPAKQPALSAHSARTAN